MHRCDVLVVEIPVLDGRQVARQRFPVTMNVKVCRPIGWKEEHFDRHGKDERKDQVFIIIALLVGVVPVV